MFKPVITAALLALASPAMAEGIDVSDAYARSASPTAMSGAAFMILNNTGPTADRLVGVHSSIAKRTELHTHKQSAEGVMQMLKVEDGFEIPAGGTHALARGGDHVMLMGLNTPLGDVTEIEITLTFEKAGPLTITVPVDMAR